MYYKLLTNVHLDLPAPTVTGSSVTMRGRFKYYHYNCDSFQDQGWGCGYRTLQSMCSWIIEGKGQVSIPPSLPEIQKILVDQGDKPQSFVGSRDWIGTMEVCYVIDALYGVSCKILHINSQDDIKRHADVLNRYFEDTGGLIMMGGDMDASSKGIAGLHITGVDVYLLVIDPHFVADKNHYTSEELHRTRYVRWQHTSEFLDSSFYNLCMPLFKYPT